MKVIITGATGMVGEGVALVCLERPEVERVLVIGRRPCGISHPKLDEIVVPDVGDISGFEAHVKGYNACFFCLGMSSIGVDHDVYYATTYTLTLGFAHTLAAANPGMTFCYVAGAGTGADSRMWWARIKGKVENDLAQLPLKVYGMRPAFIKPVAGQRHALPMYRYVGWFYPIGRAMSPGGYCTMQELALSMIRLAEAGPKKRIVSGKDIVALAAEV
uniref:Putative NAD(P)-binding protein n=1 Tax=termite gut metagenome TaxID=433724 RepID=S0DGR1_9ZZZZ